MRALLSTIGSRGDVQPLWALASALRSRGQQVRLCVPPDFCATSEQLGMSAVPIGPVLRTHPAAALTMPTPEQLRDLARQTVITQFATVKAAAEGCDLLVAGGALQLAARSIAERLGIPYVYAAYCPVTLPCDHHPPPRMWSAAAATTDNRTLWLHDSQHWNERFGAVLNEQRKLVGLPPVADVRSYVFGDRPWLAADPTLGPWPGSDALEVVQTGAFILPDQRPVAPELETFVRDGAPPIYFGFGSMRVSKELSSIVTDTARALGRRAVVLRGWAEWPCIEHQPDCLWIDEVNQQALFQRVAAVVHHGGAGTTTAAAAAGAPQVVVPQNYDQHYWARRVHELGIGVAHAKGLPSVTSLVEAVTRALQPETAERARRISTAIRTDGASVAAEHLLAM